MVCGEIDCREGIPGALAKNKYQRYYFMLQEISERISSVLRHIALKNAKIYTDCYENGQFRNETAGCSSAETGSTSDKPLSKRETHHDAGKRRGTCLSAPAKTCRAGNLYRTGKTYLQKLQHSLSIACRWPRTLS